MASIDQLPKKILSGVLGIAGLFVMGMMLPSAGYMPQSHLFGPWFVCIILSLVGGIIPSSLLWSRSNWSRILRIELSAAGVLTLIGIFLEFQMTGIDGMWVAPLVISMGLISTGVLLVVAPNGLGIFDKEEPGPPQ